jgi:membrane protease YdiL (CAAX protease family)
MKRIAGVFFLLIVERLLALKLEISLWQWIGLQSIFFSLIPLIFIARSGIKWGEVGLSFGNLRAGLRYAFILLVLAMPFMIYGASLPEFKAYYPIWWQARTSLGAFILLEIAVFLMMFNTEFLFRGLLLFSLERRAIELNGGRWLAITLHAIVYMAVHIGKPGLEVPYSFFVGLVFGWLALRTRSIFPSLAAHWTSSVIFDALVIVL